MSERIYYYADVNKKPVGPYTSSQLQDLAARGVIGSTTKVIRKGDKAWVTYLQLSAALEPAAPVHPVTSPRAVEGNPTAALSMVKGPATFMMVLAILWLIGAPLGVLSQFIKGARVLDAGLNAGTENAVMGLLGGQIIQYIIIFTVNIFILIGAIKMKKCQSYGLAMAASILCILCDWLCICLGLGAGIWSIVVLCKPEVKAAFR